MGNRSEPKPPCPRDVARIRRLERRVAALSGALEELLERAHYTTTEFDGLHRLRAAAARAQRTLGLHPCNWCPSGCEKDCLCHQERRPEHEPVEVGEML